LCLRLASRKAMNGGDAMLKRLPFRTRQWINPALGALGATALLLSGALTGVARTAGATGQAASRSGQVLAWGINDLGELGDGTNAGPQTCFEKPICSATPVEVRNLGQGVVALAAGADHSLALTESGRVMAWGVDGWGQLGDGRSAEGASINATEPIEVKALIEPVVAVAAGYEHSLALTTSGRVMAWGWNGNGALGDDTFTSRSEPVEVKGLGERVVAIAAGGYHSLALTQGGKVMTWGWNGNGQLGDGTTSYGSSQPVEVKGLGEQVVAIAGGAYHSLALTKGGKVMAWGGNQKGQLGDGTNTDRYEAVEVTGLSDDEVVAIAAGIGHSLALTRGGKVMAWGWNSGGELGDGTTTDSNRPVEVEGLGGPVAAVSAGFHLSLALKSRPLIEQLQYKNWALSGAVNDKRLAQAIRVPEGSTFNGSGELNTETGAGSVRGSLAVPPFTIAFKLLGALPVDLGMTLRQGGAFEGTLTKSETVAGDEKLTIPAKLQVAITSVGILGLKIPTDCTTAEPLALSLSDQLTREELVSNGWSFAGSTTVPDFTCAGGLPGRLFGFVLNSLLSGPGNSYALSVKAASG
jgi:alpha-tubulin suppressor-like RCC1 family protein